jgi:hypothetical protein
MEDAQQREMSGCSVDRGGGHDRDRDVDASVLDAAYVRERDPHLPDAAVAVVAERPDVGIPGDERPGERDLGAVPHGGEPPERSAALQGGWNRLLDGDPGTDAAARGGAGGKERERARGQTGRHGFDLHWDSVERSPTPSRRRHAIGGAPLDAAMTPVD